MFFSTNQLNHYVTSTPQSDCTLLDENKKNVLKAGSQPTIAFRRCASMLGICQRPSQGDSELGTLASQLEYERNSPGVHNGNCLR
jgi:hypothetical protein